jgi:hypothetical protein
LVKYLFARQAACAFYRNSAQGEREAAHANEVEQEGLNW